MLVRSGLIKLEHPRAKAAGLKDGDEPIQIYFHVLTHPTRGVFIVDTGVETALRDAPNQAAVHGMLASAMHLERMKMRELVQSVTDRALAGKGPLRELRFSSDADRRFQGVRDLFSDGSLFALHVPGHTPGSLAFVARTADGPVLMTGDTCHTVWGWQHDVEPGSFTSDRERNVKSLAALRRLAKEHPQMKVLLGQEYR